MSHEIQTIRLALPYRMGSVNCFLVHTGSGYVLVDTGGSNARAELENELVSAGCTPGQLELVVLTHGDFVHAGNAAHLRETFGARLAMHAGDVGMVERGDLFWNRTGGGALMRLLAPLLARLFGFGKRERFTPDLTVEEGTDLTPHPISRSRRDPTSPRTASGPRCCPSRATPRGPSPCSPPGATYFAVTSWRTRVDLRRAASQTTRRRHRPAPSG